MPDLDQIVFRKWENETDKTKLSNVSFETKVYEFAGPGNKFNFIELYVSFLKNPNYIIRVYYNTNKISDKLHLVIILKQQNDFQTSLKLHLNLK